MLKPISDFLEREGGHAAVCLVLILMGAAFYKAGIPKGEDLIVGGMSILARGMMGQPSRTVSVEQTNVAIDSPK